MFNKKLRLEYDKSGNLMIWRDPKPGQVTHLAIPISIANEMKHDIATLMDRFKAVEPEADKGKNIFKVLPNEENEEI